jgi:hypothetical protein
MDVTTVDDQRRRKATCLSGAVSTTNRRHLEVAGAVTAPR